MRFNKLVHIAFKLRGGLGGVYVKSDVRRLIKKVVTWLIIISN